MNALEFAKILTTTCCENPQFTPRNTELLCQMFNAFYTYFIELQSEYGGCDEAQHALDITICLIKTNSCFENGKSDDEIIIKQFDKIFKNLFSLRGPDDSTNKYLEMMGW